MFKRKKFYLDDFEKSDNDSNRDMLMVPTIKPFTPRHHGIKSSTPKTSVKSMTFILGGLENFPLLSPIGKKCIYKNQFIIG